MSWSQPGCEATLYLGTAPFMVKARPDPHEFAVEKFGRQRHQCGAFGPDERAVDSFARKQFAEGCAVKRHLAEIERRHIVRACRRRTIGLEIDGEYGVTGHREEIDSSAHACARAEIRQIGNDCRFRARAGREGRSELRMIENRECLRKKRFLNFGVDTAH